MDLFRLLYLYAPHPLYVPCPCLFCASRLLTSAYLCLHLLISAYRCLPLLIYACRCLCPGMVQMVVKAAKLKSFDRAREVADALEALEVPPDVTASHVTASDTACDAPSFASCNVVCVTL